MILVKPVGHWAKALMKAEIRSHREGKSRKPTNKGAVQIEVSASDTFGLVKVQLQKKWMPLQEALPDIQDLSLKLANGRLHWLDPLKTVADMLKIHAADTSQRRVSTRTHTVELAMDIAPRGWCIGGSPCERKVRESALESP